MSLADTYQVAIRDDISSRTAFGQLQTAELTPITGWTFAYNVNDDMVVTSVAGSGQVTHDDNFAVLSTTAAAASSATLQTRIPLRYIPGMGGLALFTAIFSEGQMGSQQLVGIGNEDDGLFFGYQDTTFGCLRRRAGVDTWYPASEWRQQHPGNFEGKVEVGRNVPTEYVDPTYGNVFMIRFQWLGFGQIGFFVENPGTGELEEMHYIAYANQNLVTSIKNPTLPLFAHVENTTNDSAITVKTPSAMAFVEGKMDNPAPPHPFALARTLTGSKTGITTQTNVLTIRNKASYAGVDNRVRAQVRRLSIGCDGTKINTVRLVKNTTLGGTPSFADYSTNRSPVEYDTAGTTITGGTVVFAAQLSSSGQAVYDLDDWGIVLAPGESLSVTVQSSISVDVSIALQWVDLF